MNNIAHLLSWIFFGDFGLLTVTPQYLFLVLFPIMIFLGFLEQILSRIPFLKNSHPLVNQCFYIVLGLGCTTAALTALETVDEPAMRRRMIWILILLVPCSSQIALAATFACMVTFRVFLVYLAFCFLFIILLLLIIDRCYPLSDGLVRYQQQAADFSLLQIIRNAFQTVAATLPSFCAGSIAISLAMYFGLLDWLSSVCGPLLEKLLHLPPQAASLLLLNVLKRDFSSASLLSVAGNGTFDAIQLIVLLIMLTFSVPCFNSSILLFKQQKLPMACFIWLGSLCLSVLFGRIVCSILLVCFV
ncbi:nucleoside recognition domain-containing protein [Ihubacter sp. mB4P-1]|uniref:nucleoside recognition domain-containing protein n=1 Tax=Ihubacter sp. mB4P-1 TaxID=3242370 RepID=UPI003C7D1089